MNGYKLVGTAELPEVSPQEFTVFAKGDELLQQSYQLYREKHGR